MSNKSDEGEMIHPPNRLKLKASAPGGISVDEATQVGDKIVTERQGAYLEWSKVDLEELCKMVAAVRADPSQSFDLRNPFYRKLNDVKGQAGTFGFPLITLIGERLCDYLEDLAGAPADPVVIEMHCEAMLALRLQETRGPGGPGEQKLLEGLTRMVERAIQKEHPPS
jgi:hypothetical protein